MQLHPAVAFGSVIAGVGLLGGVGAILALPAAAVIQAIGTTYMSRHDVVDTEMTKGPLRPDRPGLMARIVGRPRTAGDEAGDEPGSGDETDRDDG
jgi:hypothetical protein